MNTCHCQSVLQSLEASLFSGPSRLRTHLPGQIACNGCWQLVMIAQSLFSRLFDCNSNTGYYATVALQRSCTENQYRSEISSLGQPRTESSCYLQLQESSQSVVEP